MLLKVYSDDDFLYLGQESSFALRVLPEIVAEIQSLPGLHLAGLTHFPCLLWDEAVGEVLPTPNLHTLTQARDQLARSGIALEQLNAPSATSCTSLPLLTQYGIIHAGPGHALTGTIPANQQDDQPERIAMLWLSEVSHHFRDDNYCYGGDYYRRSHAQHTLVFAPENQKITEANLKTVDDSSANYTLPLVGEFPVSSAVVLCFHTQIFVTRSDVVLVSGIHRGEPEIVGRYDSLGNSLGA